MFFTQIFFYLFSIIMIASAVMVVTSRNPVHSVLFLILCFFNAAALFLIAGAEFLAFILLIVYVGAVAVLFLFVVMMLDIDFTELRAGVQRYAPIGALVGLVLLIELVVAVGGWKIAPAAAGLRMFPIPDNISNTDAIGRVLYTHYAFLFESASLVLMVAMVGAIALTHRDRVRSKAQQIARQNARQPADTLKMLDVPVGVGVKELGILRPNPALDTPGTLTTLPQATDTIAVTHKPGAH